MQQLFALLFLIFSSVILGDNVSDSMLLSYFDASLLPVMFILNAILLFIVSAFFMTLIDRVDRGYLLIGVLVSHLIILSAVKVAITLKIFVACPFLYSYSYSSKMILFMVFWTVVNDIIDARDAKRLFPRIAAGGVLGGITISFVAAIFAPSLGAEGLMVVWLAIVSAAIPLSFAIHKKFMPHLKATREPSTSSSLFQRLTDFRLIRNDNLLRHMAIIYFLTFILLYANDFIFLSTLKENFLSARNSLIEAIDPSLILGLLSGGDADALILKKAVPTFLGLFKGIANTLTLIIQFTIAGFILRSLGTVKAMLVMPICLFFIYGSMVAVKFLNFPDIAPLGYPFFGNLLFTTVLFGLTARIALFDAIYSPNFQIFFSALNKDIRGRGKILIEGLIKPFAILAAGLFILTFYESHPTGSLISLFVFSFVLIVICLLIKKSYTKSIAKSLGDGREERLETLLHSDKEKEENAIPFLQDFIEDTDTEIAEFATFTLASLSGDEPPKLLWGRFSRASESEKIHFLRVILPLKDMRYIRLYEAGLFSISGDVTATSLEAIIKLGIPIDTSRISRFVNSNHDGVRAAAAVALWKNGSASEKQMLQTVLREVLFASDTSYLKFGIRALAASSDSSLWPLLEMGLNRALLLGTDYTRIAIEAASSINDIRACRWLMTQIPLLEGTVLDLIDKHLSLYLHEYPELVEEAFNSPCAVLRIHTVKALVNRSKDNDEAITTLLEDLLETEVQLMFRYASYTSILLPESDGEKLLSDAVNERKISTNLSHFLMICAALYPNSGLKAAANRIKSINKHVRASALELLDNTTSIRPVKLFLKLIDKPDHSWIRDTLRKEWREETPTRLSVIKTLSEESDAWIRMLAIYAALEHDRAFGNTEFLDAIDLNRVSALALMAEVIEDG